MIRSKPFVQTLWFIPNFMICSELFIHTMNSVQTLSVILNLNFFIAKMGLWFKFATEIIRTLRRQCCFLRSKLLWKVKTMFSSNFMSFTLFLWGEPSNFSGSCRILCGFYADFKIWPETHLIWWDAPSSTHVWSSIGIEW